MSFETSLSFRPITRDKFLRHKRACERFVFTRLSSSWQDTTKKTDCGLARCVFLPAAIFIVMLNKQRQEIASRHRSKKHNYVVSSCCLTVAGEFYWQKVKTPGKSPAPRWHHTVAVKSPGTLVLFGGFRSSSVRFNDLWLLDTKSDKWSQPPPGITDETEDGAIWSNMRS